MYGTSDEWKNLERKTREVTLKQQDPINPFFPTESQSFPFVGVDKVKGMGSSFCLNSCPRGAFWVTVTVTVMVMVMVTVTRLLCVCVWPCVCK
jgi:hypothetical protein